MDGSGDLADHPLVQTAELSTAYFENGAWDRPRDLCALIGTLYLM